MVAEYRQQMEQFAFHRALQAVWEVIGRANRYIVENAPWELAKNPADSERLATVLYHLLECLRLITLCIQPVMPATAQKMTAALGIESPTNFAEHGRWGLLQPETAITQPEPLFPRLDKKKKNNRPPKKPRTRAARRRANNNPRPTTPA